MWRWAPLLPFIMVKSHIIIWMTIFDNRVVMFAEMWGLEDLSEGLVFSEVDCGKWRSFFRLKCVCSGRISRPNTGYLEIRQVFFLSFSSSWLLHKHLKTQSWGRELFVRCKSLSAGAREYFVPRCSSVHSTVCLSKVWIGFSFIVVKATEIHPQLLSTQKFKATTDVNVI